eukprot:303099-Pleurochrysis_carterae.AAC.3
MRPPLKTRALTEGVHMRPSLQILVVPGTQEQHWERSEGDVRRKWMKKKCRCSYERSDQYEGTRRALLSSGDKHGLSKG